MRCGDRGRSGGAGDADARLLAKVLDMTLTLASGRA
jgi:hypothetical protein